MVGILAWHVVIAGLNGRGHILTVVTSKALEVREALVTIGLLSGGFLVVVAGDVLLTCFQIGVGQITNKKRVIFPASSQRIANLKQRSH